ncbi:cyanobacterial phytochrome A [Nostoc linckia z18]|uniref:histidine kinase n=2 Tax=Nostoc linckia TaxID=92942 RepID=A0A9Q5ZG49_NOSLI|nr:ATP-binding protein [Nostoc linckia]PHK42422.1 cyanobacterial phytochrome A [Nostoc linckia z15]PHK45788.1 cyanobacterial phytochrome A [Nostoc linckia z16]PHJ64141.1 cyanobacterial phytochrome A [Nostoc linckia z1]PHJ69775.1 cyanobacterial phytochrome A [Nostoc linckia z3]PHJ75892.1 cyanobacterial phytochrome A [Nostoc linckia z2]
MSQPEETNAQANALTNHDSKPIHIPGSIQPHGVLLALNTQLEIVQVSDNTPEYLGKEPEDLLNQPLNCLFDSKKVELVKQCLGKKIGISNAFRVLINTDNGERYFDAVVHRTQEAVIVELEPTDSESEVSFLGFHELVGEAIAKMQSTSNLIEFLHIAAEKLQEIIGFHRVMVYQFDESGAGSVVVEVKGEDLSPYLGLHYPATDIPAQARELYTRSLLRFIPDLTVEAVKLFPGQNLDLSYSVLRSFDSCCIEYHQNMGVTSLLVISLIQEQKLWGLISCHHQTPKYLSYEVRKMCEFLGQIVSSELAHKISHSEWDYEVKLKSLQSEFLKSISQADNFIDALIKPEIRLLDLVSASGAAICLDNEVTLVGATPNIDQVRALIEWADTQVHDNLFSTDSLPKLYPEALIFKDTASGLLLLRISQVRRYYILWFRPEVIQTVNWAGDPNESIQAQADGSLTLSVRKSFAAWQETVRLTSLPWRPCELDSALSLRNAIVGIVLSKADELAKINLELERSNQELASFAYAASHDLKEPLRGIYNFSTVLLEDYDEILDDDGVECLQTVVSLSVRMETLINALLRLSQLGQAQLREQATDLNELVAQVIEVFRASQHNSGLMDIRIPRPLPIVECDRVLVNEVFSNLIGNAFKYNDKAEKWVEIGYFSGDREQGRWGGGEPLPLEPLVPIPHAPCPIFYVRDNGIGIPQHHLETIFRLFKRLHSQEKYGGGAGAGLAIVKKIVELHNGQIWVESAVGIGSIFYFTLE